MNDFEAVFGSSKRVLWRRSLHRRGKPQSTHRRGTLNHDKWFPHCSIVFVKPLGGGCSRPQRSWASYDWDSSLHLLKWARAPALVPWRWGKTVSVQQPRAKRDAVINGSIHPVPPSTVTKFPLLRNEQHLVRSINAWHDRSESNKRIVGMIGFHWHVFRS